MFRRAIALGAAAAVAAALAISGCSSGSGSSNGTASGSGENTLTWYTGKDPQEVAPLISAFEKKTGITVKIFASTGAGVASRVMSEHAAGVHTADIVDFDDLATMNELESAHVLQKLPSSVLDPLKNQVSTFAPTDGYWIDDLTIIVGIAYNTKDVPADHIPTQFTDFLQPYWKGKFSIPVSTNSTSIMSYYEMSQDPTLGKTFLTNLGNNDPVDIAHSGQQVTQLESGAQTAAIVNDDAVWPEIAKGAPLKMVYPTGGVAAIGGHEGLVAGAPHEAAAVKFLQFLETVQAGTLRSQAGSYSTIPDVPPVPASRPPLSSINFFPVPTAPALIAAQKDMVPFLKSAFHE